MLQFKNIGRDGFGPNFCGPGPIWADLLWAGPRLGPFLELDLWAWAGPGLSSFGLGWALGQIENQCWPNLGQIWAILIPNLGKCKVIFTIHSKSAYMYHNYPD